MTKEEYFQSQPLLNHISDVISVLEGYQHIVVVKAPEFNDRDKNIFSTITGLFKTRNIEVRGTINKPEHFSYKLSRDKRGIRIDFINTKHTTDITILSNNLIKGVAYPNGLELFKPDDLEKATPSFIEDIGYRYKDIEEVEKEESLIILLETGTLILFHNEENIRI